MRSIGVLALQGNFAAHIKTLQQLGVTATPVRTRNELSQVNGLIIPGGESTALLKLMQPDDLLSAIRNFYADGGALFGTCAGLILLAKEVSPKQLSLELLDISVQRNAYGRHIDSFAIRSSMHLPQQEEIDAELVFIRAPKIIKVNEGVEVLATYDSTPVLVAAPRLLGCSFHPEMGSTTNIHKFFVEQVVK